MLEPSFPDITDGMRHHVRLQVLSPGSQSAIQPGTYTDRKYHPPPAWMD